MRWLSKEKEKKTSDSDWTLAIALLLLAVVASAPAAAAKKPRRTLTLLFTLAAIGGGVWMYNHRGPEQAAATPQAVPQATVAK